MKTQQLGKSNLTVPRIAVGCMRINSLTDAQVDTLVKTSLDNGANFFDHADIYGRGECETIFARAIGMNNEIRSKMIIQTKCGIVPGKMFDFSKEHILESVDGSLKRLNTDHIDILLLHRPDALVEPEEVAAAFDTLERQGKVRHFGVSNQKPMQIKLLKKYLKQEIVANQLQLSIPCAAMIAHGMHVNMMDDSSFDHDGSVLDYCRLNDITIQPWSPFQYGFFEGVFVGNDKFPELNKVLDGLAKKYGITATGVAIAWLARHPAKFQTVTGTTNPSRILECIAGADTELSREDWYKIYLAAGYTLP